MAEPITATASPLIISGSTIYLAGSFFGLEYESMIAGCLGGFIALGFMQAGNRWHAVSMVLTSAILAGFVTPIAAAFAVAHFPELAGLAPESVRLACACLIGIGAHTTVPIFLRLLRAIGRVRVDKGEWQ
jgi:hypothetical protein